MATVSPPNPDRTLKKFVVPADEGAMTRPMLRPRLELARTCVVWLCFCLAAGAFARLYANDEPKRFGYPESIAAVLHKVEPVYPEAALRWKIEGRVEIDAYVETDGSVYSTIIVVGDPKLVDAAADAVKQWRFQPFQENGRPIQAIARLVFHMKPPASTRASR